MDDLTVIGGGLAGCEAAWQAAQRGVRVNLYEMRPAVQTGAHTGGVLAELVCSNSLGSNLPERASGLLKAELRRLGSLLIDCADGTAVPAGTALAVDREAFARLVTERIQGHANIRVLRREVTEIPPAPVIIASGPLTSACLSTAIADLLSQEHLYFYDAIAPIVTSDSIDMRVAFRAARYARESGEAGDYINCPLDKEQYDAFVAALLNAERIPLHEFEQDLAKGVRAGAGDYFEGCLPIEVLARRGQRALAFGPLRPVGLSEPASGKRPYAVVQLRQDNLAGTLYNLVGFQTNLTYGEQRRVLRMIPGLEQADFVRYGQMHRNTFIYSPGVLQPTLQYRNLPGLFFAGQICGVEGYAGNIATGLLAGWNAARYLQGKEPIVLPADTMVGALCRYIVSASPKDFQPMKANFGLLPELAEGKKAGKRERGALHARQALASLEAYVNGLD